jgi:PAS domain S-box-containing protein
MWQQGYDEILCSDYKGGEQVVLSSAGNRLPSERYRSSPAMDSGSVKEKSSEVELVEAVNGSRSGEALRASEEKYRILFEAIEQGLVIGEVVLNAAGDGVDYRILETTAKFEHLMGLRHEAFLGGKTFRELISIMDDGWLRMLGRVAVSGESARFEIYAVTQDRWFDVHAFRIGDPSLRRVASLYNDISSQQRTAQASRNSEKIQKFLLKLSDVLRPIADPVEIMRAGPEVLARELDMSVAGYVEMSTDGNSAVIGGQYADGRMPQLAGACKLSEFGDGFGPALAAGEEIFISDIYEDPRGPAGGAEKTRGFKIRSVGGIPQIKDGRLVSLFYAAHFETRPWLDWEREIVRQTADRTWAAVERARAQAALRESEEKYRGLFDSIDQAYAVVEVVYENGAPTDVRFVEANRVFEKQTGLTNYVGKTRCELNPRFEAHFAAAYARVAETGEPVRFESYSKGLGRWFSVFASRIGGEGSHLVNLVFDDVTARKQAEAALRNSEEKQAFKLKLDDAIRPLSDPIEIQGTASRILGEHLRANRVFYGEIDEESGLMMIEREFVHEGMPSAVGPCPMEVFASLRSSPQKFEPTVVKDVQSSQFLPEADRAMLAATQAGAFIAVPLIKDGRLVACLCATNALPRDWTQDEVELIWRTGERTWAAVERARAETALRASEEKYRTLFDSIDNAIAVLEVLYDDRGVASDLRFIETNQAFEKGTGLRNHLGKTSSELLPNLEDSCIQHYASVAETGEPVRFESYSHDFGRWLSLFASRVGVEGSRRVNVIFDDITERKQAEANLRESEERQAYLLKLSDALRPLADPTDVQGEASRLLGEQLQTDRAFYSENDEARGLKVVERDFVREGMPSLAGSYPLEAFAWIERSTQKGEPAVIENVRTSPLIPDADRLVILGTGVSAFVCVPLVKGDRKVGSLVVADLEPRIWKPGEIEVVRETAERTWAAVDRARVEAALRASEGRYRTLFESIDQGYTLLEMIYDASGVACDIRFLATNRVFERQTGMTDYPGKTARGLNPNLEDHWVKTYAHVVETGESARFDRYVGEIDRWFNVFASRVGDNGSRIVSVIFDDITERKQAEAALREREERKAFLLKLSDALRPLSDPIEIEGTASRLLGEQLRADRTLYAEIDAALGDIVIARDFVRGGAPSLVGRYPMEDFAWIGPKARMSRPTVVDNANTAPFIPDPVRGTIINACVGAFVAVPLVKDSRQVAALCVCELEPRTWKAEEVRLVQETAERTWAAVVRAKAETALRESEERFRLFLENVHEYALVQLDTELRITSWNPGAERIFGYTSKEALGQPFALLLSPEDRADHVPCTQISVLEKNGRNEDARWLIHKDGTRIWTRWVTEPIRNKAGQITGLAKVLRDETERLRTEMSLRQSEKLAVVGRMASSIAHEINNPLEAVTNLIYLARRGDVSSEVGEFLQQAEHELARVSHVTLATLHFHRQTTEPQIVDIEEILESVLVLHEGRLKSMQIATERRYSLHPPICCQGNEVRQVIANLVSNAIDAMKNMEERRLIVRVRKVVDPATKREGIRVMIADSGMGIRESARKHVFEPFFTTKPATGTGLGLWLSSETVNKHNGTLRFRSRTDGSYRGTVFSLFLQA